MAHFFASGYPQDANAYLTENNQVRKLVVRAGAKLTNTQPGADIYSKALSKMFINLAETSLDPRIIKELKEDAAALKRDKLYQSAPAFSFMNDTKIWIREFSLAKGEKAIAANIIHEAAHLAGAPGNILAELALDGIHNAAGLKR